MEDSKIDELLSVIMSMHKLGIYHNDLHDGNILLYKTNNGILKAGLIDLGRSTLLNERTTTIPQGAPHRNPPEALLHSFASVDKEKSDVYALGCTLYYLFFSKIYEPQFLFTKPVACGSSVEKKKKLYQKILKEYTKWNESFLIELQLKPRQSYTEIDLIKEIIVSMIHPDPERRASLSVLSKAIDEAL